MGVKKGGEKNTKLYICNAFSSALVSALYHATDRQRTSRHASREMGGGGSGQPSSPRPNGREERGAEAAVLGGEGAGESCASTWLGFGFGFGFGFRFGFGLGCGFG